MSARILVVEDDDVLREVASDALAGDGHDVAVAPDGEAALRALADRPPDLVLLDLGLGPGMDGVEVCRRLRRSGSDAHVLVLTARGEEDDVVTALEAGADDHVTKPVGVAELRSRVRAALRRAGADAEAPLRHGAVVLEPATRRVLVGGEEVALTPSEHRLLDALLRADGAVLSRAQLVRAIFGDEDHRDPRAVDVHVHHLREKLVAAGGDPAVVTTVRGAGYRRGG